MRLFLILCVLVTATPLSAEASPNRDFKPISGSIKSSKVNVRAGPGTNYPILWSYHLRGYPVKAISQFGVWYKIIDIEGEEGWIYQNFFTPRKTAMISAGAPAPFFKERDASHPTLILEQGVVILLKRCALGMCEVEISGQRGWVKKTRIRQP